MVWDYQIRIGDFDFLIFRNTWDYFEKKLSLIRGLKKNRKLGIKTLNPIGIIKQNKHSFIYEKWNDKVYSYYLPFY
jgi:hypothetical protein